MIVTALSHPKLFKAFLEIDYDTGAVDDPERTESVFPTNFDAKIELAEKELKPLTDEQLNLLCTGEESEQQELIKRFKLENANSILHEFFESFQ